MPGGMPGGGIWRWAGGTDAPPKGLHATMSDLTTRPVRTVPLDELPLVAPELLLQHQRLRIDVLASEHVLPFLVHRKEAADGVVVFSNGAVNHDIAHGQPVFQRSRWVAGLAQHAIFSCDPGTVGPSRLSLAWGNAGPDYWAVYDIGRAVRVLSAALGVKDADRRLYYGSSAGGFLSLALLGGDRGASAIVNNAQFDWTRWMPGDVNRLRKVHFNNRLPAHLRRTNPLRTNVFNLLKKRRLKARVDYYVNLNSKHDREIDLPMMQEYIRDNPALASNIRIMEYCDVQAGHSPLPIELTTDIINAGTLRL